MRHPSGDTPTRLSNSSNLLRSRSSQSLRQTHDMTSLPNDERLTVLVQMFWISVSLLESDFEYEFLLAVRLLDKVRSLPDSCLFCHDINSEKMKTYSKLRGHFLILKLVKKS